MECWFRIKDSLLKVEHVGVTPRLLNWMLEIDETKMQKWIIENKDHVDFYAYP
jgi:hypothetical protein